MTSSSPPLPLFTQINPKQLQEDDGPNSHGANSPMSMSRQPLCPIIESARRTPSSMGQAEPASPAKPSTPRGKKRGASVYRQSENVDGNVGSASNTPEKPREKRTTQAVAARAKLSWQNKQAPVALQRSPAFVRSSLVSFRPPDLNKSTDSESGGGTPTKNPPHPSHSTGASKAGPEQTPRSSRISGKPPLDSDASKATSASSNSSFFSATPTRSVTRSLRYGATPSSVLSVNSTRGPFQTPAWNWNQQNGLEQQFDVHEDPAFWKEHNVQVILRTRPISITESAARGFSRCVRQDSPQTITWIGQPEARFTFDHVAGDHITQEKLFKVAGVPMMENCMAGYNSCMFCYGQTGSGKTHTMLGDIVDLEHQPSINRGITPRVFEYLFSKIRMEEEARKHEQLKYICKCSFLEIFNEQITDLLEPTSTNLQIREDGKKGVYVENLSEVKVGSVQDVVHLLLLGAANRKVAATNLNRESSRSHSVFTCIIESKWELDSVTNVRFGRLNLVDLAGSERQKNSGAEGERLKEAANINKSLSTLGLVIMILVDVANGKQRHVPYRDSKLTYLLQDSLGGNSKTTMIANISPSSCCALETLSTLKFAQRAKFIRNNAVVNEDASGDVNSLRQEIQELKEELHRMRRQGLKRTPSMHSIGSVTQDSLLGHDLDMALVTFDGQEQSRCSLDSLEFGKALAGPRFSYKKLKAMEAVLAGALRREQAAQLSEKSLAAEIDQLNRLVKQREDDSQCSKMMLRFREDKIKRLESLSAGLLPAETYLIQEKYSLMEELQLMQTKIDRNPELTRFAMENIRLMEQLRRFQDFYTGGEREAMADDISNLRDQLLEVLDSKLSLDALTSPQREALAPELACAKREIELLRIEADNYRREVEECRRNLSISLEANEITARQLDDVNVELNGVKLECRVHQEELGKLREHWLNREGVEQSHTQHLELISKLKSQLQESEAKAEREASMRSQLDEQLQSSLQNACTLQAELQETRGALDAAEVLVISLHSAESNLAIALEMAASAQEAVEQIRLETKAMAEEQHLSLKNIEDAAVSARLKESELREELQEANSLIERLLPTNDDSDCVVCTPEVKEGDSVNGSINASAIIQLELDLQSLELSLDAEYKCHDDGLDKPTQTCEELEEACANIYDKKAVVEVLECNNLTVDSDLGVLHGGNGETLERLQRHMEQKVSEKIGVKPMQNLEKEQKIFILENELERKVFQEGVDGVQFVVSQFNLHTRVGTKRCELEPVQFSNTELQGETGLQVIQEQNLEIAKLEGGSVVIPVQEEFLKLKPLAVLAEQRGTVAENSVTELVKELQSLKVIVQEVQEESKNWAAQREVVLREKHVKIETLRGWEVATARLLELLNEGENALTIAVHKMEGMLFDPLGQKHVHHKKMELQHINEQQLVAASPKNGKMVQCEASQTVNKKKIWEQEQKSAACLLMFLWLSERLATNIPANNKMRVQIERMEEEMNKREVRISSLQSDLAQCAAELHEKSLYISELHRENDRDQALLEEAKAKVEAGFSLQTKLLEDVDRNRLELASIFEGMEQTDFLLAQMHGEITKLQVDLINCEKNREKLALEKEQLVAQSADNEVMWNKSGMVASTIVWWLQNKISADPDVQKLMDVRFHNLLQERDIVIMSLMDEVDNDRSLLKEQKGKLEVLFNENQRHMLDLHDTVMEIKSKDLLLSGMQAEMMSLHEELAACKDQSLQLAVEKAKLEVRVSESGEALKSLHEEVMQVREQLQATEGRVTEAATAQAGMAIVQEEWKLEKVGLEVDTKEAKARILILGQELNIARNKLHKIQEEALEAEAQQAALIDERNKVAVELRGELEACQMRAEASNREFEVKEMRIAELSGLLAKQLQDWEAEKKNLQIATQHAQDQCVEKDQVLLSVKDRLSIMQLDDARTPKLTLSESMEEAFQSMEESNTEKQRLKLEVKELGLIVSQLSEEIREQEIVIGLKIQNAEEKVEGVRHQIESILADLDVFTLEKKKLETETEYINDKVLNHCRSMEEELERALEDKKQIEDVSAEHENKLLEELDALHAENAVLVARIKVLDDALKSSRLLITQKEQEMAIVEHDSTALKDKAKEVQNKLDSLSLLMNELASSEESWKSQKEALAVENKRLKSCMACREMEFSSLQDQQEALEKSLQDAHEKEMLADARLSDSQKKIEAMESQWQLEREQLSVHLESVNKDLLENQVQKQGYYNSLKEVQERELVGVQNYATLLSRLGELETQWTKEREGMSNHVAKLSMDMVEVKSCAQKSQIELGEARALLSAADAGIEHLLRKNSALKETNKQLYMDQEVLQKQLSNWEQYAAEFHKTSSRAPSPCNENRSTAASEPTPLANHFEILKGEVEMMRCECQMLQDKVRDKESTILSVQMELNATILSSRKLETELDRVLQEREKLEHQLDNMTREFTNAQDEINCRETQVENFESELQRVMEILAKSEEKLDECEREWRKQRAELEAERDAAKLDANEKGGEVVVLRRQFDDGQNMFHEAERLINALVQANESAKRDVLKWKLKQEEMVLQSSDVLAMVDEDVRATMSHMERDIQTFGLEIHEMRVLLKEGYLDIAVGFHHELEEAFGVQIAELGKATEIAQAKVAALNAKLMDVEKQMNSSKLETEILQSKLNSTEAFLTLSQVGLEHAMKEAEANEKRWEATRQELELAMSSISEKEHSILELSSHCNHISARIVEVENSYVEKCQELTMNSDRIRELELEKVALHEATQMQEVAMIDVRNHVQQLERSVAEETGAKKLKEMEVVSISQYKESLENKIHSLVVGQGALHDEIELTNAKLLEKDIEIEALHIDAANSRNQLVSAQMTMMDLITEIDGLRQHVRGLEETEARLRVEIETKIKSFNDEILQLEGYADEAMVTSTQLEIQKGHLLQTVSLLENDKRKLLAAADVHLATLSDLIPQILQLETLSQDAIDLTFKLELELEILKTLLESTGTSLLEKETMTSQLKNLLEQSHLQNAQMLGSSQASIIASSQLQHERDLLLETVSILENDKRELQEGMEARMSELSFLEEHILYFQRKSEDAISTLCQQEFQLGILETMLESASNELRERDDVTTYLRIELEHSHMDSVQIHNALHLTMITSSQLEQERDQLLEIVRNLEVEKRILKEELDMQTYKGLKLETQISELVIELQEGRNKSFKNEIDVEILTTMFESIAREARDKDVMTSHLEKLLRQSHLQNAQMLQSSQEFVNHFSLFQGQLDSSFQLVSEFEREKLALNAEVLSQSQAVAELRAQMQACDGALKELRVSTSQLEKQKDAEVLVVKEEAESLKSKVEVLESNLWDWKRQARDAEVQLIDRDSTLQSLKKELLLTQKRFEEDAESVDEQLQEFCRQIAEMESDREALVQELNDQSSMIKELQEKLETNESAMEEHFTTHCIEQGVVESLENERADLQSLVKHLTEKNSSNQQRAVAAENELAETRLEMEALERELKQKDDLLQGLEFDIGLLQESALQELHLKQEVESSRATMESLQHELNLLRDRRTKLEADLAQTTEEALQFRNQSLTWKGKACAVETELDMKRQMIESLEDELQIAEQNLATALEDAFGDLKEVEIERDQLQTELLLLNEQLEMAQATADERDAVASEARLIAELSKTHAEEKEDEAKLLSRSVEELESTVYALECQLGLLKSETERQRLMREDIEMELQRLNNHIFMMQSALEEAGARSDEVLKEAESAKKESERILEEKEAEVGHLQQKLENVQIASKDKDVQITDAMAQISDLLLAAEIVRTDFQQRLKALESMVEQAKFESQTSQPGNSTPKTSEKVASDLKAPGSSCKCMDTSLAQQISSECYVESFSLQHRIEELEVLASSRQKEIFMLNSKLAEAESMTHDVLRDLLGVKLDMTSVASMLGQQQIQQLAENSRRKNAEAEEKEAELSSLRSQISDLFAERERWLEEVNQRQCEMVAARVAAEKLRQREKEHTEEVVKCKERIQELELEAKKLPSGQQSLQQQIYHHSRIKEENVSLKLVNEKLSEELKRKELQSARVNDELVHCKVDEGTTASPNIDEEQRLRCLLQDAEDRRVQEAQKLLVLCTAIMQAAGLSEYDNEVEPSAAMDALQLLENRLHSIEQELSDSKMKTKSAGEKRRPNELRANLTPLRSISNTFTSQLQRTHSPSPAPR